MKEKKEIKIKDVTSLFIYESNKNYIYCGPFSKTGYILSNKEAKAYTVYTSRYYLPLSISILAFIITNSIIVSIICLIVLFILMEFMFRKNVLSNCPVIDNFQKPTKNSILDKAAAKFSATELITPLILLTLLAVAIPVNAYYNKYESNILIMNYIISGLVALLAIFVLICIIYIKKKNR